MDWIIVFIANWILFFILVDWKKLKVNIWGGIVALALQFMVDAYCISKELYLINNAVFEIKGSSVFFMFGPVFVIGILLAQYHPIKNKFTILNCVVISLFYSMLEYLLLIRKDLVYIDWSFYISIILNFFAMVILSWFTIVALRKTEECG